ncbi:LCP family protein [Streptomyces zagrosensis]|uniref:LCP family protein required for cell wall assembly n=1 Tax=Streptomyces zagrosensis TaxID=1042984 RepID=A0A7W9V1M8_9ACTN|nr:LCP family protein [Streptomyces zagrosensis]MBB5939092.1 LCP family protein required for cell wall assembly [Streptomyces zagrosensis]
MTDSPDPESDSPLDAPFDAPLDAPRRHRWLRWTAVGAAALVLLVAGAGWVVYERLDGNITTDTDTAELLRKYEAERPTALVQGARNILLIGSDDRGGRNGRYGRDVGTQRSDTTILLHLSKDRDRATAVSIPRDLMVLIPHCERPGGQRQKAVFGQFNYAFEKAGASCTIRTVEQLTGVRINHHLIVDFDGFKKMINAVDGVEVCLATPMRDHKARVDLPAGHQVLNGEQALGFVRARYTLGNGSDTQRIARQQAFMSSLVRKMQGSGVLLNPTRLYPVLDAATSALTTDPGLDSLRDLYNLVRGVRNIPSDKVEFMTIPRRSYRHNVARDEIVQPDADRLFGQLREDRPVTPEESTVEAANNTQRMNAPKDDKADHTEGISPRTPASPTASPAARGLCEKRK